MNVQKENGYTPIASEILDKLCSFRIPGESRQILDAIFRKTYGYNKKEDRISGVQFTHLTGLKRQNVWRARNSLIEHKIVIKSDDKLRLNKNLDEWISFELSSKPITSKVQSKPITPVIKSDDKPVIKSDAHNRQYNKQYTKDREDLLRRRIGLMLEHWNTTYKTSYRSVDPLLNNYDHWSAQYSVDEIKSAITKVQYDKFWKDKMTPTMLLRRKNPRGEDVDYIGTFLQIKTPDQKAWTGAPETMDDFISYDEAKQRGLAW